MVSGLYGYVMLSSSQKKPRSTGIAEVNRYNTGRPTENSESEEHVHTSARVQMSLDMRFQTMWHIDKCRL